MTRTQWGMLIAGVVLVVIIAVSFFVDTAEAGCKKHPEKCHPQPTPTATVTETPTSTPTAVPTSTPTATVTVTPEPEEPIDTCFFHPTNPCTEGTSTPTPTATLEATPTPSPVATAVPSPAVVPTPVVVQLPPSGVLPGAPNTGSAGLRSMIEMEVDSANCWFYLSGRWYYLPCGGLGTTKEYTK